MLSKKSAKIDRFLLFLFLSTASCSTLIYKNFFGDFSYQNGIEGIYQYLDWYFNYCYNQYGNFISYCNGQKIFGGSAIFNNCTFLTKSFELPPHYQISISLKLWNIDYWQGEEFFIHIDNNVVFNKQYCSGSSQTNLCGQSINCLQCGDSVDLINKTVKHFSSLVTISLYGMSGDWGIQEFQIVVDKCPKNCSSCDENGCFNQILHIELFNTYLIKSINTLENWVVVNSEILSRNHCLDFGFHGNVGNNLMKQFRLDRHDAISIRIKILVFNLVKVNYQIFLDDTLVEYSTKIKQLQTNYNYCNMMIVNQLNIKQYQHINSTLTIKIVIDWLPQDEYNLLTFLDIIDFQLFIKQSNNCLDNKIYKADGCNSERNDCVDGCGFCYDGQCLECKEGRILQPTTRICVPHCGDMKIEYFEECDDGNNDPYDGCHQCKYSCPKFCEYCQFGKCIQCIYSYQLINGNCQQICQTYSNETYLWQKNQGCYYNLQNFIENGYYYHDMLNNKIDINYNTNCNKYNYEIFGFYYGLCNYQQIDNCKINLFQTCIECLPLFQLYGNSKQCVPQCNDGLLIENETCDDNNNIQFDGCYKCQQSCQLECLSCIKEKCYECQHGWSLIDNRCFEICGDNIQTYEQCDDGNFDPYDGCYNCKFVCDDDYCLLCTKDNFCLECQNHFEQIDGKCRPKCGDGYVVIGLEECDDGNLIQGDGCYECQFQCPDKCEKCVLKNCLQCQIGYELIDDQKCQIKQIEQEQNENQNDQQDEAIKPICGDSLTQQNEECDDGNAFNNDGCSESCIIEHKWYCDENTPSFCFAFPQFRLTFIKQIQDKQYVELSFNQKVKWIMSKSNFSDAIFPEIEGVNFSFIINPIIPIEIDTYNDSLYEIEIQIQSTALQQSILKVSILDDVQNEFNSSLANNTYQLQLKLPVILNSSQKQVATQFKSIGNSVMIGLGCASLLMLLFGDISSSLEIFDILQFQSYLKFINLEIPQNLQIYFSSSDFVTLTPYLVSLNIFDIFDNVFGQNYLDSQGKLQEYQLNADLLTNVYGLIFQIIILFVNFLLLFCYRLFIFKNLISKINVYLDQIQSQVIYWFLTKLYILNKKILKFGKLYTKQGFNQFIYANSWDILFKVVQYLDSKNESGPRTLVSDCICVCYFGLLFILMAQNFRRHNKKIILSQLRNQQYEDFVLFKKILSIIVLICMQTQPECQCILLTFIMFFYLIFTIILKLKSEIFDIITILFMEAPVMIFTLSCLAYCKSFRTLFNNDQIILLGFYQIGLLILGLFGPLIKSSCKFGLRIKDYISKMRKPKPPTSLKFQNIFTVAKEK